MSEGGLSMVLCMGKQKTMTALIPSAIARLRAIFLPLVWLLAFPLSACSAAQVAAKPPTSVPPPWKLTWSDEFNLPDGSVPDTANWEYDLGGGGFGNHELESYTRRPENARIEGGKLVITAIKESFSGTDGIARDYTSARLKTEGNFDQAYGRFEARIRIPYGQGMWPAFWMLGNNITSVGWPDCGEIDIMENIGKEPATVHGTIHGPGYSGAGGLGSPYSLTGGRFADDFHVYAVEWEPSAIRFYVDNVLYETRTPADLPPGTRWVYDHPFFIILNLAIGGDWPGSPDAATVFPQTMLVDYVRVYTR